jgi:hypothetical protein
MSVKEFQIGDTVTLDRYNHIDDVCRAEIIGYDTSFGGDLMYVLKVWGKDLYGEEIPSTTHIKTTGTSIMESKDYEPVPDEERHPKQFVKKTFEEWKKSNQKLRT